MGEMNEYGTITGHARLSRYTGGNEDDLCASESLFQSIGVGLVAGDNALGVDVANISGDTYSIGQRWSLVKSMSCEPGPPLISYRASSVTRGLSFISRDSGCPIPPAPPRTVTFDA